MIIMMMRILQCTCSILHYLITFGSQIEWIILTFIAINCYIITSEKTINSATVVTFVIEENLPIDHEVGRIQLEPADEKSDHDINKSLTFSLQDTTYFDFDVKFPNRLLVKKQLDRDSDRKLCTESGWPEICAWSGVIFASDGRLLSLRIVIRDLNDNTPRWLTRQHSDLDKQPILEVTITENRPIGTMLDLPLAYDPDIGDNSIVKYELIKTNEKEHIPFDIQTKLSPNGAIYRLVVQSKLDREVKPMYQLTLAAIDGGGNRGYAKLLVHIADENDNAPIFTHLQNTTKGQQMYTTQSNDIVIDVDEDIPVGSKLPNHPVATDMDEGEFGHVTYRFSLSTSDVARRDFKIDRETGEIIIRSPLDYDTGGLTQYAFVIVAEDGGQPSLTSTARILINVRDKNDNAPEITITPAILVNEQSEWLDKNISQNHPLLKLIENTPPGALIATVTVFDPDTNQNGKFTCQLGDTNEFSLVYLKNLGKLSVYQLTSIRLIDRELQSELRITIRCQDHGENSQLSTELLTIKILDVNDNPPQFQNKRYSFQTIEGNDAEQLIGQLTVYDPDYGVNAQLTYSINWPNGQGPNPFYVNSKGEVIARVTLDRENQPEGYHFIVIAHDSGQPSLSNSAHIEVALIDVNDCSPIFSQSSYHFSIEEELSLNNSYPYIIGQIKATDCDLGLNAQLVYLIESINHPFQISSDGYLSTTKSFDREEQPAFLLQVTATDSAEIVEKRLSATAQIHVTVLDINDHSPMFVRPPFQNGSHQIEISYNDRPGHLVARLEATDEDIGSNGKIQYFIVKQTSANVFTIRPTTGEIFLQKELTIQDIGIVTLILKATDSGKVVRTSTTTMDVKITDQPIMDNSQSGLYSNHHQQTNFLDSALSIFSNVNLSANKLIIICIILITFIICAVLITVIITVSKSDANNNECQCDRLCCIQTNVTGDDTVQQQDCCCYYYCCCFDWLLNKSVKLQSNHKNHIQSLPNQDCNLTTLLNKTSDIGSIKYPLFDYTNVVSSFNTIGSLPMLGNTTSITTTNTTSTTINNNTVNSLVNQTNLNNTIDSINNNNNSTQFTCFEQDVYNPNSTINIPYNMNESGIRYFDKQFDTQEEDRLLINNYHDADPSLVFHSTTSNQLYDSNFHPGTLPFQMKTNYTRNLSNYYSTRYTPKQYEFDLNYMHNNNNIRQINGGIGVGTDLSNFNTQPQFDNQITGQAAHSYLGSPTNFSNRSMGIVEQRTNLFHTMDNMNRPNNGFVLSNHLETFENNVAR